MEAIPLAVPMVGEREAEAAAEVVRSGWLTSGPRVVEFEKRLAKAVGARDAVAVSNGTTAIELALRVVGVGPGDVVLTVSHSFIATANAIRACGAHPVFVDIDPLTRNLCPAALAQVLKDHFDSARPPQARDIGSSTTGSPGGRLAAILLVHQIGLPADLKAILAIADKRGVPVVEDAACALGSTIDLGEGAENIGSPHGAVATFSFHPRKVLTTGEGGALSFRDPSLASRARQLRNHGQEIAGDGVRRFASVGFNFRMSDICAAIGLVQLDRLNGIVESRRKIATLYNSALAGIKNVTPPHEPSHCRTNYQSYIVTLAEGVAQDDVIRSLTAQKIASQPGIMCAHLADAYGGVSRDDLRHSEEARRRGLTLPLFPEMTEEQVERVAAALRVAVGE